MPSFPLASKTVLIVDDDRPTVKTIGMLLKLMGFETLEAFDGITAAAMARSRLPDLILLDLFMPRFDGWRTLERLKSTPETSRIPVLLVESDEAPAGPDVRSRGAAGVLQKPFDPGSFYEMARKILTSP